MDTPLAWSPLRKYSAKTLAEQTTLVESYRKLFLRCRSQGVAGHCSTCKYCWHSSVVNDRVTLCLASATKSPIGKINMFTPNSVPTASRFPSGLNEIGPGTTSLSMGRVNKFTPVIASHNRAVPSILALAIFFPSGVNAREVTA